MKILIPLVLLLSLNSFANTLPTNRNEFCARYSDAEAIKNFSLEATNLLGFKNNGGLFNGGTCWWHSRFQRNIFYLTIMQPEMNRPDLDGIKKIIKDVRAGMGVVHIPGYQNIEEFSRLNEKLIQKELNDWQLYDGVILGGWMDGLKGDTRIEPSKLSNMMSEVFTYVEVKKKIAYEKLQIKGVTSHAWLIIGMKKMPSGFEVGYIDSNSPQMCKNYSYKTSDDSFFIKGYGNFVPYLEFKREEERLTSAGKEYCGIKTFKSSNNARDYNQDLIEAKLNL